MCYKPPVHDLDVIHDPVPQSIYVRTDYIVNSDMSINMALAGTLRYGFAHEAAVRTGLPQPDREPMASPLVLKSPHIPHGNIAGK